MNVSIFKVEKKKKKKKKKLLNMHFKHNYFLLTLQNCILKFLFLKVDLCFYNLVFIVSTIVFFFKVSTSFSIVSTCFYSNLRF